MPITRRCFMKGSALALVGTSAVPQFLVRSVMAETATAQENGKKLVVIFQRGAADGLNIVVPYAEPNYYALRPTIAIPKNQVINLDGDFGLHPALAALAPLYRQGHLAVVHAVGSPSSTRSHFDAQDYMEAGTPGLKSTQDGWLNRALQEQKLAKPTAFRAVSMGADVARTLQGRVPAVAMTNVRDFNVGGRGPAPSAASNAFQAMYGSSADHALSSEGNETFEAMRMLKSTDPAHYVPANGVVYPNTPFSNSMKQVAQLMKANLGVEAAFADIGDWDTHVNQGSTNGRLSNRLKEFSEAIAAFWHDMGQEAEHITLVTMSEFGRTVKENGTGGTDHGHGNVMFVLGGAVRGGKVYGSWPGLATEQLNQGRDLAVTTDYRQVLGELTQRTLGTLDLDKVFPGAALSPGQFLRMV